MGSVSFAARSTLHRRWVPAVLLTVVLAIALGASLAAVAGARRANSAIGRFERWQRVPDAGVMLADGDDEQLAEIERLPEVVAARRSARQLWVAMKPDWTPDPRTFPSTLALSASRAPSDVRVRMLAGRPFDPRRPDEVVINEAAARTLHLGIGSKVRLAGFTPEQMDAVMGGEAARPAGPHAVATVVGISRVVADLGVAAPSPGVVYRGTENIYLPPALWERSHGKVADFGLGTEVTLRRGAADYASFRRAAQRIGGREAFVYTGSDDEVAAKGARRSTRLESLALWAFGLVLGAALVLIGGQAVSRQVAADGEDAPTLAALGMTRPQIAGVVALRSVGVVAAATVLGIAGATWLSTFMPIGLSKRAEIDPGLSFDTTVLLLGAAGFAALLSARAVVAAWRRAGAAHRIGADVSPTRPPIADRVARMGAPVVPTTGLRFAFDFGRGQARTTARSALGGALIGIVAVSAALVFASNLDHLVTTPAAQGWRWDAAVGNPHGSDIFETGRAALRANPAVAAAAAFGGGGATIEGQDASVLALRPTIGSLSIPVLDGRLPAGPSEIALGGKAMKRIGAHLGDTLRVQVPGKVVRMRLVGQVLVSPLIMNDQILLGEGAVVAPEGAARLAGDLPYSQFIVRFRPGTDHRAAVAALKQDFPQATLLATRPADVENLRRVRALPTLLAALLAVVAIGTITHHLLTSAIRRRRDLTVLKSIGFAHGQVFRIVIWQASALIAVALLVGIPIGVAIGRVGWRRLADDLALGLKPGVPFGALAALSLASLVLAGAAALAPAIHGARTPAAEVLRSE